MNYERLLVEIRDGLGPVTVDQLSDDSFRVLLPSSRHLHDALVIGVQQLEAGWLITDGGQLAYLLEDDFLRIAEVAECAGAPFVADGKALTMFVSDDEQLPSAILSFAHYIAATPIVWHAIECARPAPVAPPSVDIMARETKARLVETVGPRVGPFVHLRYAVKGHGERYPAPLAIAAPASTRPPELVASFIDTAAPPNSVTAAKRNTAFMLQVVREYTMPKYVVVRGEQRDVEHFADFYDSENTFAVSSEHLEPLYDDTAQAVQAIMSL